MVQLVDVSPVRSRTTFGFEQSDQSVSGKALAVAMYPDGRRVYIGGHSGVWRSDDGGVTWVHPELPQPPQGTTSVPGALLAPSVYDLHVSTLSADVVLAATGRDGRQPARNGIYRSTDAARHWTLVHQFVGPDGQFGHVGSIVSAPDDPLLLFSGGQFGVSISRDGGATWAPLLVGLVNEFVWYVACGPQRSGGSRMLYAVGDRFRWSTDGGDTWIVDVAGPSAGSPSDSLGSSARCLCIDPIDPGRVYVARQEGELWRGDLSGSGAGPMAWVRLPAPPVDAKGPTASGTDFVVVRAGRRESRQFVFSDRRTVHMSVGEPTSASSWTRIDGSPIHVDPRSAAVSSDFNLDPRSGRIVLISDGGPAVSSDGAESFQLSEGPPTLGLVNTAVLARANKPPVLVIQMGDNNGFFSADGGEHWITQDYRGGDNDCSFSDPRQPERLIVFAPRSVPSAIFLYQSSVGDVPDGGWGTGDRQIVPSPPPSQNKASWNVVSYFYDRGYRPLVLATPGTVPSPGGDFVTIVVSPNGLSAQLLRSTKLDQIESAEDWLTLARSDGPGVKVFRQGPALPNPKVCIVQASGGQNSPTFLVGDQDEGGSQGVWSWQQGQAAWRRIVPAISESGPSRARRFFVDPYRPSVVYVLGSDHVWRSGDGGTTWSIDIRLETALTEDGAFPVGLVSESSSAQTLLRDLVFDPDDPTWRVAVGPAGVFLTLDGDTWQHILLSSAAGFRPLNAVLDTVSSPCARMLYVSTSNRGLLRLGPLPPDWEAMPGGVSATVGLITMLRVHDVGTGFGPPGDELDAEVIAQLDTEPGHSFGLSLRHDGHRGTNESMFDLLRASFDSGTRVRIEFIRTSCSMGRIIRVVQQSGG